jgi:hypothetical protein
MQPHEIREIIGAYYTETTEYLISKVERHAALMHRDVLLIEAYLQGEPGTKLKKMYRVDVYNLLRKYNIPRRRRGAPSGTRDPQRTEEIRRHIESGVTFREIGEQYGISRQRIQQIAARFDIFRTDPSKRRDRHLTAIFRRQ